MDNGTPAGKDPRGTRERTVIDIHSLPIARFPAPDRQEADVDFKDIDLTDTTYQFRVSLRVDDLARAIEQEGQLIAIVLRRVEGQDKLQLVCGFRRVAALQKLDRTSARAVIRSHMSDDDAFKLSLGENQDRQTLGDLDRAHAISKWRDLGRDTKVITKTLRLQRRQVERLLKLLTFPAVVQEALSADRLLTTHALTLMQQLGQDVSEDVLLSWITRIETERLSVDKLTEALKAGRKQEPSKPLELFRHQRNSKPERPVVRLVAMKVDVFSLTPQEKAAFHAEIDRFRAVLDGAEPSQ